MSGIGTAQWVNDFVGIPYEVGGRSFLSIDCYGLVALVYRNKLGIELPDWVTDTEVDWDGDRGEWLDIEKPVDFCILRTERTGSMPDHFGLFIGGGVLSAGLPSSSFVSLRSYLMRHPNTTMGVFSIPEDLVS